MSLCMRVSVFDYVCLLIDVNDAAKGDGSSVGVNVARLNCLLSYYWKIALHFVDPGLINMSFFCDDTFIYPVCTYRGWRKETT
jgi:hypothetical protein